MAHSSWGPGMSTSSMQLNLFESYATCSQCRELKPTYNFSPRHETASRKGHVSYCRACANKKAELYRRSHGQKHRPSFDQKISYRKRDLKRKHGITLELYEQMHKSQRGLCAICSLPETNAKKDPLSVDHDHETGIIRGLLCDKCNRGIGLLQDSREILESAIRYLGRE